MRSQEGNEPFLRNMINGGAPMYVYWRVFEDGCSNK